MNYVFAEYCKKGDLANIKKISLKGCDLENGFKWASRNGHYMIVQYLIGLYKIDPTYKPINIHADYESSLRWACINEHYDIVKYLIKLYRKHLVYKPIKNYLIIFKKIDKYLL